MSWIVSIGDSGALQVWRRSLQTLLVDTGCDGMLDLLPGLMHGNPGSPRQGSADPGLYYATPLGLM